MKKNTRLWLCLILLGFLGQLAWVIENMYFNVFVYNTLTDDVTVIARMVSLSAVTATLTTLLMGAWSDKVAKRKIFICLGYFIWGLTVTAFAFLNLDNLRKWFPAASAAALGGWLAILMDCVMTFFGSTANDACFNAWVTDSVPRGMRAKVEGVLATLPLVAMLVVFGALDPLTQQGRWSTFFMVVGALTSLGGLIGWLFLDDPAIAKKSSSFRENLIYGFRREVIRANRELYAALLCLLVYSIAVQIFMPYLIIYIQTYLGITDYALILGVILIGASVVSVLVGDLAGKVGSDRFFVPSVLLFGIGLIAMYFVRRPGWLVAAGLVMMSGYLIVSALISAKVRDDTPADKAGQFQGIRMIFGVMLPMIIGPYVGAWVIRGSQQTYVDLGTVKQVPTPGIWLASAVGALAIFWPYHFLKKAEAEKASHHHPLTTPFSETLDPDHPLPEYPRPQLARASYLNLNGRWDYAILPDHDRTTVFDELPKTLPADLPPQDYDGTIVVPFSPECALSGVNRTVGPQDVLWYHRTFTLPAGFDRGRILLHFGAVDQCCVVYLNGEQLAAHSGGYLPFTVELTGKLKAVNDLAVRVKDFTDTSYYSRGKQSSHPGGIWYTAQSGIWQTVWLESVPQRYIHSLKITPDYDHAQVKIAVQGDEERYHFRIEHDGTLIAEADGPAETVLSLPGFHPWSPDDPFLYDLIVSGGRDTVRSYFGMRCFTAEADAQGIPRFCLNHQPLMIKGVLDQGYWPDGLYTAPGEAALEYDIRLVKQMGFNTARKHIKIEPLRWYYLCDKLGLLVWQDMVSGGTAYSDWVIAAAPFLGIRIPDDRYKLFGRESQQSREDYRRELTATVDLLYNCVALMLWTPFNEGWGQFDAARTAEKLKALDPTRLVDHASGWHDQKAGDLNSRHIYFSRIRIPQDRRISALTEYGGYSCQIPEHSWLDAGFGYRMYPTTAELQDAFLQLHEKEIRPQIAKGLSAIIYTQLSDVEGEVNGLVTWDRRVVKYDPAVVRRLLDELTL